VVAAAEASAADTVGSRGQKREEKKKGGERGGVMRLMHLGRNFFSPVFVLNTGGGAREEKRKEGKGGGDNLSRDPQSAAALDGQVCQGGCR